jgi:hypothetical protein
VTRSPAVQIRRAPQNNSGSAVQLRLIAVAVLATTAWAQDTISTTRFTGEVDAFLGKEMTAHIADIKSLDPPQTRVVGALTTGEYSWGTFMRSAAVTSQLMGADTIAGRDMPRFLGQLGLIEARGGGKAFSQMYAGWRCAGTEPT